MPDGYTHVVTGMNALNKSHFKAADLAAFGAGANGPDPLFFYNVWQKKPVPDLMSIGSRMHKEKTGAFLLSLVKNADTPVKKSYVAGFLTHYATDQTAHPYVSFLTDTKGAPYNIVHGHGFYECTLDSELYKRDYGTRTVKAIHATPTPSKNELKQITELFHTALLEVYGEDISVELIEKSFYDILRVRKWLTSRFGIRKAIFGFVEKVIMRSPGHILSNLTPGGAPKPLPESWVNPFTGEERKGGMPELLAQAEITGTEYINKVDEYWNGKISLEEFSSFIGNKSYETGLEL